MTRFTLAATTAAVLLALTAGAPVQAAGTVGDCYNRVIESCNKKKNDQAALACSKNAMNACDKLHSGKNNSSSRPTGGLKLHPGESSDDSSSGGRDQGGPS